MMATTRLTPPALADLRPSTLVIGHQRSGTSLVANALSAASGLELRDDPPWTFNRNVRPVVEGRLGLAELLARHRDDLDGTMLKAPSLTPVAAAIAELLPDTRFVCVVRDPRDTVAATAEWRAVRDKQQGRDFWDMNWLGVQAVDGVQALAQRWDRYMRFAAEVQGIAWARYEDFVDDPDVAAGKVLDRIGVGKSGSAERVRGVQMKKDFNAGRIRGRARWREDLCQADCAEIERWCGPWMDRFGYARTASLAAGAN